MYDYHVHTTFSSDASMEMEQAVKKAIEVGIKEIGFTDHAEFSVWRMDGTLIDDYMDLPKYVEKVSHLKEKYRDRISIKLGAEIGLQREEKQRIDQFVHENAFDFIMGSSHTIERIDLYYKKIYESRTKEEAYEKYFKEVLEIVKMFDSYNVYGHLDLIRRYALGEYEDIELNALELELVTEILKVIIHKGKGIELNTSGFRYGLNSTNPGIEILELYRKLGGEIITVGSDAHRLEHIGFGIPAAYEMLKGLGYRYVTIFEKMEPTFVKI